MNKLFIALVALVGLGFGIAFASNVTTTDGQNFSVTNDAGVTANYTMSDLNALVAARTVTVASDQKILAQEQQTLVFDTQAVVDASGVQQLAVNAQSAKGLTSATCATNTDCWSGVCTNSVCN